MVTHIDNQGHQTADNQWKRENDPIEAYSEESKTENSKRYIKQQGNSLHCILEQLMKEVI